MTSTSLSLSSTTQALQPSNRHAASPARTSAALNKALPATPKAQTSTPILPSQPGTWRHPQMDAIARRQNQSVFGSENSWSAVKNAVLLLVSLTSPPLVASLSPDWLAKALDSYSPYYANVVLAIRLFFLANLIYAFRPFFTTKDDIDDIPLTPSQRALLGLKPSSTPLTPGSRILTPPRYSRSATPKSSSSDRGGSPLSGSPLSGKRGGGSVDKRGAPGSPFSGSPLVREALTGGAGRRLSFDVSQGGGSGGLPGTPTPVNLNAGRATVGLNNKWLYQHTRGSPNGRSPFS